MWSKAVLKGPEGQSQLTLFESVWVLILGIFTSNKDLSADSSWGWSQWEGPTALESFLVLLVGRFLGHFEPFYLEPFVFRWDHLDSSSFFSCVFSASFDKCQGFQPLDVLRGEWRVREGFGGRDEGAVLKMSSNGPPQDWKNIGFIQMGWPRDLVSCVSRKFSRGIDLLTGVLWSCHSTLQPTRHQFIPAAVLALKGCSSSGTSGHLGVFKNKPNPWIVWRLTEWGYLCTAAARASPSRQNPRSLLCVLRSSIWALLVHGVSSPALRWSFITWFCLRCCFVFCLRPFWGFVLLFFSKSKIIYSDGFRTKARLNTRAGDYASKPSIRLTN